MKISVIVPSRFHGFDMASYFQKEGVLNELVTGYPRFIVKRFGIDTKLVHSIYINELIDRATNLISRSRALEFVSGELFDMVASRTIRYDSDVYFIWSGFALRTMQVLRKKNKHAKIILVRGSAHIQAQEELLKIAFPDRKIINKRFIAKELLEYQAADYITVPSTFAYNSFIEKRFPKDKLFLNLLGVNLSAFPFSKKELNKSDALVVGNVGQLSRRKNVAAIISVIEKLNSNGCNIKLTLVGAVDNTTFDEQLLKKDFITYKGKLPQNELYKEYAQMDLFVINSIEEGLAVVQLQAMSCGLPIISTTNAGGLDLVKDGVNGFTIPILDDKMLEEKILWFYHNKKMIPQMGAESNIMVNDGLTWDDFGKRNVAFAEKISNA